MDILDVRKKIQMILEATSLEEGDVVTFDLRKKKRFKPAPSKSADVVKTDGTVISAGTDKNPSRRDDRKDGKSVLYQERIENMLLAIEAARLSSDYISLREYRNRPEPEIQQALLHPEIQLIFAVADGRTADADKIYKDIVAAKWEELRRSRMSIVSSQDEVPKQYGPNLFGEPDHMSESVAPKAALTHLIYVYLANRFNGMEQEEAVAATIQEIGERYPRQINNFRKAAEKFAGVPSDKLHPLMLKLEPELPAAQLA